MTAFSDNLSEPATGFRLEIPDSPPASRSTPWSSRASAYGLVTPWRRVREATGRRPDLLIGLIVLVAGLAARFGAVYAKGSIFDGGGYDQSVYYASADALLHGLVPYRDYTLLHPPGLSLLLAPWALIGQWTRDQVGFEIATVVSICVGALNSVLVTRICRRMDLTRTAALVAGLLYAVTQVSVRSEQSPRLEVWGNFFLLLGLLFFASALRNGSRRAAVLMGVALATAASVKMWYAVPMAIVLLWYLGSRRSIRQFLLALSGALLAAACIDGPFLILAGRPMVAMVVTDQFGRKSTKSALSRIAVSDLASSLDPHKAPRLYTAVTLVVLVVLVAAIILALRVPLGRLASTLFLVQLAALLGAPVFFYFYPDYVMPAACLCIGAAVHALQSRSPSSRRVGAAVGALLVAMSCIVAVRIELVHPPGGVEPAADTSLQQAVAGDRCVQASTPMPLIALNVLSRDLANGCPQWVDVSGRTYAADRSPQHRSRFFNQKWQRDILRYLLAGNAFIIKDAKREGLDHRTMRILRSNIAVAKGDTIVIRDTNTAARREAALRVR